MPIARFFKIPISEHRLFWEAYSYSIFSRLLIWFVPIRYLSFWLGRHGTESEGDSAGIMQIKLYSIAHAIRRSSKHALWPTKCLVEAMVAKRMLNKRKIQSTIYLGVAKESSKTLIAHAWVRVGDTIIVGKRGMERFKIVATFS